MYFCAVHQSPSSEVAKQVNTNMAASAKSARAGVKSPKTIRGRISSTGGYSCEFVDSAPEDFHCEICAHVAREPHLSVCCGKHYCQGCIAQTLRDGCPCPSCGEDPCSAVLDRNYKRKIMVLQVHCTMKQDHGCEWVGKLEDLETHLEDDCQYVNVQCPQKCGEMVLKKQLQEHKIKLCQNRKYTCMYCGLLATFSVIQGKHEADCSCYPVLCPNGCSSNKMKRLDLEGHLKQCSLQPLLCDFSSVGCEGRFSRQDLEKHMELSVQSHLLLLLTSTQKELKERDKKIEELEAKIRHLHELVDVKDKRIEVLKEKIHLEHDRFPPYQFYLNHFSSRKAKNEEWLGPPIYTGPRGYKFCLKVWPNGVWSAHGKDLSVFLLKVRGEFDDELKWPVRCTITLQLLNQHRDRDHVTVTREFEWSQPTEDKQFVSWFTRTVEFITHRELECTHKEIQFLKNDRVLFRIRSVEMH